MAVPSEPIISEETGDRYLCTAGNERYSAIRSGGAQTFTAAHTSFLKKAGERSAQPSQPDAYRAELGC